MSKGLGALLICSGLLAATSPTAVDRFAALQQQAHSAHQSGNKRVYLQAVLEIEKLLNDAPDSIEAVAQAYAEAGDARQAVASLDRFAALGQSDDNLLSGKDRIFSILHGLPEYKSILDHFAQNETAVSRAELAFTVPDPGILAEDIDYDPQSKSFLVTSVLEKKIIRVASNGTYADFAQSPSRWSMLALKIDAARQLVWATEVAMDGFAVAPKSDWGRSAVLCFGLTSGALIRRIEAPPHSALGDMVLAWNGDPIVSDGGNGRVYRVRNGALQLLNDSDFISPQTPALLPGGNRLFVPDYARGIAVLDLDTARVTWLNREHSKNVALNGIDGLYLHRGSLLLTQNGTSPERVIRLQLDEALAHIVSEEVIERATPALGDPTHGVVVGDAFFYIANSGWSKLDDHGNVKLGSKLSPARVMRFTLQ